MPRIIMQFTPQEMKLIERLRTQERRWPRTRWILIGAGAFLLACYGAIAYMLFHTLGSDSLSPADSALLFALFWPKVLLMALVAFWLMGLAIKDWRGNVHRMLLLRLLDAQQKEADKDEHTG